jgi:MFS family permease
MSATAIPTDRASDGDAGSVAPARGGAARDSLSLAVVLAGSFIAVLDLAIVNVAIPAKRNDLHVGFGAVELVISVYALAYGCLFVTRGRLGDMYGRGRLFIVGLLVFTGTSALCGAAPTIGVLIGARALQGVGGALMYPQVLAIIQVTFYGPERARALGLFGSTAGMAAVAGQLISGALLGLNLFGFTWRPAFPVNVPVGILTAVAAVAVLPDAKPDTRAGLDWGGPGTRERSMPRSSLGCRCSATR